MAIPKRLPPGAIEISIEEAKQWIEEGITVHAQVDRREQISMSNISEFERQFRLKDMKIYECFYPYLKEEDIT